MPPASTQTAPTSRIPASPLTRTVRIPRNPASSGNALSSGPVKTVGNGRSAVGNASARDLMAPPPLPGSTILRKGTPISAMQARQRATAGSSSTAATAAASSSNSASGTSSRNVSSTTGGLQRSASLKTSAHKRTGSVGTTVLGQRNTQRENTEPVANGAAQSKIGTVRSRPVSMISSSNGSANGAGLSRSGSVKTRPTSMNMGSGTSAAKAQSSSARPSTATTDKRPPFSTLNQEYPPRPKTRDAASAPAPIAPKYPPMTPAQLHFLHLHLLHSTARSTLNAYKSSGYAKLQSRYNSLAPPKIPIDPPALSALQIHTLSGSMEKLLRAISSAEHLSHAFSAWLERPSAEGMSAEWKLEVERVLRGLRGGISGVMVTPEDGREIAVVEMVRECAERVIAECEAWAAVEAGVVAREREALERLVEEVGRGCGEVRGVWCMV